jgi:hypothetical protein
VNSTSRLLIVLAVLGFGISVPIPSSAAEAACSQRVLKDWSDNGRIDRVYALPCYEEAIAAMPTDIRDYTNAQDVIDRALTDAVRAKTAVPAEEAHALHAQSAVPIDTSGTLPVPMALVVLFALALALLAAGALGRLGRRAMLGRKGTPR